MDDQHVQVLPLIIYFLYLMIFVIYIYIYLSVLVCANVSGSCISSFLIDLMAYNYLSDFFSTSITFPNAPLPKTLNCKVKYIIYFKLYFYTLIKLKSLMVTSSPYFFEYNVEVLAFIYEFSNSFAFIFFLYISSFIIT
jgi:hypothetical protein